MGERQALLMAPLIAQLIDSHPQSAQERPPVLGLPQLEDVQRKAVARHVVLRNGVPTAMFDGNPRLIASRLEPHFDVRHLVSRERPLAPGERQSLARRPSRDAANLERFAIRQIRHQPPAFARLEPQFTVTAGVS